MIYIWATATDNGRVRDHNEDSVWPADMGTEHDGMIAAVADGMGGHVGGEIASRIALETAIETQGDPVTRLQAANLAVVDRIRSEPKLAGMGTTLTLGMFSAKGRLEIGHVGDSRAYVLRGSALTQITTDHSLVAEMVATGRLKPEDVATHPYRSIITRALGLDRKVQVDSARHQLEDGDRVLICSDGLTNMVPDQRIIDLLGFAPEPHDAVESLVEAANAAGGVDNVTVAVVNVASG